MVRSLSIAILRDDHLGDMILTTPLTRALQRGGWDVTMVGPTPWKPLFVGNDSASYVDWKTVVDKGNLSILAIAAWLHRRKFSHAIVPYYSPRLFLAVLFAGIPHRYCQMGRILGRLTMNHCLRSRLLEKPRHMTDVWLDFARELHCTAEGLHPEIHLSPAEKDWARRIALEKLPSDGSLFVVHPFHGKSSCHPELEVYCDIVEALVRRGGRVVVTGGKAERDAWNHVWNSPARGTPPERLWISCGELELREFCAMIGHSDCLICGSTGALQIASALNKPSVSAFCPHPWVNDALWGSVADKSVVLHAPREDCIRGAGARNCDCRMKAGPDADTIAAQALLLAGEPD